MTPGWSTSWTAAAKRAASISKSVKTDLKREKYNIAKNNSNMKKKIKKQAVIASNNQVKAVWLLKQKSGNNY